MSEPLLVLDHLSKSYRSRVAVADLSLEVQEGEFIALVGPSGCGKSTSLRMIAGLEQPSSGELRLRGRRMNEVKPWNRDMPMVWQSLALFPHLTVLANVEFSLKMRGMPVTVRRERAMEWLHRLGISAMANRNITELSGGERQRVALARALVVEPALLLLDEPLSALDANLVVRMQAEISRLHSEIGISFIYVTHNQSEAFAMADRVVVMAQGSIQQVGTPREVYRAPQNRFVAEFIGANNILSGTIEEVRNEHVLIGTAYGQFVARRPARNILVGKEVTFVISADQVAISTDAIENSNKMCGKLISEEFVGSVVMLHIDIGHGIDFRVQTSQRALGLLELTRGRSMLASWSSDDVYILP